MFLTERLHISEVKKNPLYVFSSSKDIRESNSFEYLKPALFTPMHTCFQASVALRLLAHCFESWRITTTYRLLGLCETIGGNVYCISRMLVDGLACVYVHS